MKAALDLVVLKQGVFNLVFHPHGWIKPEQVVELIDHAVKKHGKKVKFLNFREAQERLNKNLLARPAAPRRRTDDDNRVRLVDLNKDGYMDVVGEPQSSDLEPASRTWATQPRAGHSGSCRCVETARIAHDAATGQTSGSGFVDIDEDGHLDRVFSNDRTYGIYLFDPATKAGRGRSWPARPASRVPCRRSSRNGTNNGFFVHSRSLWWQNEDTAKLPDHRRPPVVQRSAQGRRRRKAKSPAGRAAIDPASRRGSRSSWWPASRWSRTRSPSTGAPTASSGSSRWATIRSASTARASRAASSGSSRTPTATAATTRRRPSSTACRSRPASCPGGTGVLVACAPDIFYAEDRDGDGKADHREVLFTGFTEGNQQHRLNGFELGLDGWVYGANGDSGGTVRSIKTGKTVNIQGRDFRFRPDTGEFETESGQTQYGRHRDDWGNWFGNNNPTWGWHLRALPRRDLKRNPYYAPPDPRQTLEPDTRLYPASRTLARFNDPEAANHVTSANSPTPYRDDLFGPHFATSLFVSEPVHNLVHRMVLEPDGATFAASARPARPTASSSPRPTTGSGRRSSRPGPTAPSGSPTCTAR